MSDLGPEQSMWLVGVKAGGNDDAVHIVRQPDDKLTLCEQIASSRNLIAVADADDLDSGAGCWTCMSEARKEHAGHA